MNPRQKRRNPFDRVIEEETKEEKPTLQPVNRPEVQQTPKQTVFQPQTPAPQPAKRTSYKPNSYEREKYTSTMAKTLRKQIKIACVNKGILFAQYVEEACREKLEREGMM